MLLTDKKKVRGRSTRGAIFVEFIVAFMPLIFLFLCMMELTRLFICMEAAQHAAAANARACAVIQPPNPGGETINGKPDGIEKAGKFALKKWTEGGFLSSGILTVETSECKVGGTDADPYAADVGHVKINYRCSIPMAKFLICPGGAKKNVEYYVSYPHQGAQYQIANDPSQEP